MRAPRMLLVAAAIAAASLAVGCNGNDGEPTPSPTAATAAAAPTTPAPTTATPTATETAMPTTTGTPAPDIVPADGSATTETAVVDYVAQPAGDGEMAEAAECFAESVASRRGDAWRCSVGNTLYDPCFALDDRALRCFPNPVSDDPGVLVEVAEALPERETAEDPQVWLLELSDGTVCGYQGGATAGLDGERVNYGCTNGEWILGFPAPGEDGRPWTGRFLAGHMGPDGLEADDLHEENIATAWR